MIFYLDFNIIIYLSPFLMVEVVSRVLRSLENPIQLSALGFLGLFPLRAYLLVEGIEGHVVIVIGIVKFQSFLIVKVGKN
jgi:hypothetical protein